jgi:hypothetical protein
MVVDAERQLDGFIDKFDPAFQRLIRDARERLRARFPTAFELAYDNYNFLVLGYSSTERPSDAIVSLSAGANGVGLCFLHGARLPDPSGLLLGDGKQTRFIRLESAEVLARPAVESLIVAAIRQARTPLRASGGGTLTIRSVSGKQRPRRKAAQSA